MTKKKSFLERMGLVESAEEEFNQEELMTSLQQSQKIEEEHNYEQAQSDVIDNLVMHGEDFLTIDEVYASNGLLNKDNSIFKVEEIKKHLPDNFPAGVLRQSVIGLLSSTGLTVDELTYDAEMRLEALNAQGTLTSDNTQLIVKQKKQEIQDLLLQVDKFKQDIIDREEEQKLQTDIVSKEIQKVAQIVEFITEN